MKLDDIRAAADRKYASLPIELEDGTVVQLLNPLRLSEANRKKLVALQDSAKDDDVDQVVMFRDMIRIIADTRRNADALIKEIGDDLAVLATTISEYGDATRMGEASGSHS